MREKSWLVHEAEGIIAMYEMELDLYEHWVEQLVAEDLYKISCEIAAADEDHYEDLEKKFTMNLTGKPTVEDKTKLTDEMKERLLVALYLLFGFGLALGAGLAWYAIVEYAVKH